MSADKCVPTRYYVLGLLWDEWTAQVESQITRDLIALQDEASKWRGQKLAVSSGPEPSRVLRALDVPNVGPLSKHATFWRIYQMTDTPPTAPEWAEDQMVQKLHQDKAKTRMVDTWNKEIYLPQRQREINYDPFSRRPRHPGVAPESPWLVLM